MVKCKSMGLSLFEVWDQLFKPEAEPGEGI